MGSKRAAIVVCKSDSIFHKQNEEDHNMHLAMLLKWNK